MVLKNREVRRAVAAGAILSVIGAAAAYGATGMLLDGTGGTSLMLATTVEAARDTAVVSLQTSPRTVALVAACCAPGDRPDRHGRLHGPHGDPLPRAQRHGGEPRPRARGRARHMPARHARRRARHPRKRGRQGHRAAQPHRRRAPGRKTRPLRRAREHIASAQDALDLDRHLNRAHTRPPGGARGTRPRSWSGFAWSNACRAASRTSLPPCSSSPASTRGRDRWSRRPSTRANSSARASSRFAVAFDIAGVDFETSIHPGAGYEGDLAWSVEALENILKNCMEHTPAGGTVRVRATEDTLACRIRIEDTGPGIDEADLPPRLRALLPRQARRCGRVERGGPGWRGHRPLARQEPGGRAGRHPHRRERAGCKRRRHRGRLHPRVLQGDRIAPTCAREPPRAAEGPASPPA